MVAIRESTIIDAPCDAVWRLLRDFNGHAAWHPAIAASRIEGDVPADTVGAVRRFTLKDGGALREQLLAISDEDHTLTYCLLEAPLPLMGYVATMRLRPVTDGDRTLWEWRSEFWPPESRREELTQLVRDGIYRAGFAALRARFGGNAGTGDRQPTSTRRGPPPVDAPPADSPGPGWIDPLYPAAATASGEAGTTTARAIVIERHGGPDVLELRDVTLPPLAADEVRVRHSFIGVNYIDVYCRTGFFDLLKPPGTPGMEAAGTVEAVGRDVRDVAVGDRVAYASPPVGAYCSLRNMPAELLLRLPGDIADELAAAALLKGITASFLLHDVHMLRSGQRVLVHAAAGGVGQILVQWAKHLGATVFATVSTEAKAEIVRQLGADHVIVHRRADFADEIRHLTGGRGVDVAYDAIGRDSFARTLASLGLQGHLVSYGQASGPVGQWDIGALASKSITVSRPNYAHYTGTPQLRARHAGQLFDLIRRDIVAVAPPRRYALADAGAAHRDLEARATTGSLVLVA